MVCFWLQSTEVVACMHFVVAELFRNDVQDDFGAHDS